MATQINAMYENSLLAMAAYAEGDSESNLESVGFSSSQAAQFLAKYEFINIADDTLTGFSGTFYRVLSGDNAGQIVFALRGTDFSGGDIAETLQDLLANVGLGIDGTATSQILDMMNYYFRAISPATEQVKQYSLLQGLLIETASAAGLGIAGLDATTPITVTGHSLGGHLAQAFATLFPAIVSETYTYNGVGLNAGVGSGFNNVANLLSNITLPINVNPAVPSSGSVHNVVAEPGKEFTAIIGEHFGHPDNLFIEQGGVGNILHNHSIANLTDALAVYDLLSTLDGTLTVSSITTMLYGASNVANESLENIVNATAQLLVGSPLFVGVDDRNALYTALESVKQNTSGAISTIVTTGAGVSGLASGTSESARGYRYALINLLPFAITSNLTGTVADDAKYDDVYSSEFLADRALMLGAVLQRNVADSEHPLGINGQAIYFEDRLLGTDIFAGQTPLGNVQEADVTHIVFDDDSGHFLNGAKKDDRLYGMGGADTLIGNGGNDYLEGGEGQDTYQFSSTTTGGFGVDTIVDSNGILNIDGEIAFDLTQITAGSNVLHYAA